MAKKNAVVIGFGGMGGFESIFDMFGMGGGALQLFIGRIFAAAAAEGNQNSCCTNCQGEFLEKGYHEG
mgnify:CR=1 FL=1